MRQCLRCACPCRGLYIQCRGLYDLNAATAAAAVEAGGERASPPPTAVTALRLLGTLLLLYGQLVKSELAVRLGFVLVLASYGYPQLEGLVQRPTPTPAVAPTPTLVLILTRPRLWP